MTSRRLRQPVLVGIGLTMQREADPAKALEPLDLMLQAVRRAGADACGDRGGALLEGLAFIAVPKGRWRYRNPAGEIARSVGARSATTVLADVGVLQQSLIGEACRRIAAGEIDSALVAGADAGWRMLQAKIAGTRASERQQDDEPDVRMQAEEELLHPAELRAGIRMPVPLYAMLESAWRAKQGLGIAEHRRRLGEMYERFAAIAAANPHAWRRTQVGADEIREASERNPMQAFPYTRMQCANWNVDQGSALLFCSAERAESLGVPRDRWIHPWASTESNHMVPVSARADLAACTGARIAGRAALEAGGVGHARPDLVELYSCFPIAVEAYADALGIPLARDLSVTGGMSFAGGPFNNYVLHATGRMAELLREGRGESGIVSSVSGILTKQGFGLWGRGAGPNGFVFSDLTGEVGNATATKVVEECFRGRARIAACTVMHEKGVQRALVLADTESGGRALASSNDAALIKRMQQDELCGAVVKIEGESFAIE